MRYLITLITVTILILPGCRLGATDKEKMLILASALTKLSAAVESTVRYKNPPKNLSDMELLTLSTKHDPKLLEPFLRFKVRILRQDRHAIVLVCLKKKNQALLEDSNCTAGLDKPLWKIEPPKPCEFTLTVRQVCSVK